MNCKIFVINLDSNLERLNFMKKQCDRLGLEFERIAAIRGRDLTVEQRKECYSIEANTRSYDSLLTDGEIGCYLSHIHCWQKIIEEDLECALILEDDAELLDTLPMYVEKLIKNNKLWDYVELSHGSKIRPAQKLYALGDQLQLATRLRLNSTTTAQLVSYQGAQKLLKSSKPIKRPVDIDLQFWYEKSLRCFSVSPFPVKSADFESDISAMGRKSRGSSLYKRLVWQTKHKWNLRRYKNQLLELPFL